MTAALVTTGDFPDTLEEDFVELIVLFYFCHREAKTFFLEQVRCMLFIEGGL